MATCVAVSSDLEFTYSMYPSEPILAEAAAYLMSVPGNCDIILTSLHNYICEGVAKGDRGELVSRIILLAAFDKVASSKETANYSDTEVSVSEFVSALCVRLFV